LDAGPEMEKMDASSKRWRRVWQPTQENTVLSPKPIHFAY
jgi:hypothetical protein